jgi:hypothetical protein
MRRSDSGYGNGSIRMPLITLKIAVVAPMPSASVRMVVSVKPGVRSSRRMVWHNAVISSSFDPTSLSVQANVVPVHSTPITQRFYVSRRTWNTNLESEASRDRTRHLSFGTGGPICSVAPCDGNLIPKDALPGATRSVGGRLWPN